MQVMRAFIKEKISDYPRGWGNGYVLIPANHPFNELNEDSQNELLKVHGELTWGMYVDESSLQLWPELTIHDIGMVLIGFDTNHGFEDFKNWPKSRVKKETDRIFQIIFNYGNNK